MSLSMKKGSSIRKAIMIMNIHQGSRGSTMITLALIIIATITPTIITTTMTRITWAAAFTAAVDFAGPAFR